MSYQIIYNSNEIKTTKVQNKRKWKLLSITIILVVLFGILKFSSWDNAFWDYLIPGNANVTRSALQDFTDSLKHGDSFSDAIFVFCETVIQGAALE